MHDTRWRDQLSAEHDLNHPPLDPSRPTTNLPKYVRKLQKRLNRLFICEVYCVRADFKFMNYGHWSDHFGSGGLGLGRVVESR